jgi:serine/threonine-protein kinase HipA
MSSRVSSPRRSNEDDSTVAEYFELEKDRAKATAVEVGKAVSTWGDEAARHGIHKSEIERIGSAFEHEDLKAALGK